MQRDTPFSEVRIDSDSGERYLAVAERGAELLKNAILNKGSSFTRQEREDFGLIGMLPDHVSLIEEQLARVANQMQYLATDMDKNIYLNSLMDRNETLFYRVLVENLETMVPLIYTPTVATACRHWSKIFRRARGIYITPRDRGRMVDALKCRPKALRPVIVVTDNERILGIGDQGAGGMGIPIGKLALYAAAAGIHPSRCIPISLDVGTNNAELLADPLYIGYRHPRVTGDEYREFIAEFVAAVQEVYPDALLQWEDFSNRTSFENLFTYREQLPSFNDDIQGTAAMVVAGLKAATRHTNSTISNQRIVIVGAGSAGIGIRDQIATAMEDEGSARREAEHRIMVLDSQGLIVEGRENLSPGKQKLALPREAVQDWEVLEHPIGLADVIRNARATVLIGVSGVPDIFTEEMVRAMAVHAERPIIMPLSNPTSHAEVTPAHAIEWTEGRSIVATGSPFPFVDYGGRVHQIGQANNVFVFPGIGLGVLTVGARKITDRMFLAASKALADSVPADLVESGQLYPSIADVRKTALAVARAVAHQAIADGLAAPMSDVDQAIEEDMWFPEYLSCRAV